jgi:signal transduction histidine kinase
MKNIFRPRSDAMHGLLYSRVWYVLSYSMLVICLTFALLDGGLSLLNKGIVTLLAAVWGGWYWVFVMRHTRLPLNANRVGLAFIFGMALSMVMCWIHPAFLMMAFSFYGLTFAVLPLRWATPLVVSISLALAARFIAFSGAFTIINSLPILFSFLLSSVFAVLLGLFITRIIDQTHEKERIIAELEAARGELAQAERQAGMLEERQRLAGEIHDTLAQGFTSVVLHLEAAEQSLDSDPTAARRHIDQARSAARDGLAESRRFLWALRPDVIRHEPLDQALRRVAGQWSEQSSLPAHLEVSGEAHALPSAIEATLLRAAQETLVNVRKHAHASQVNLTLTYMEDEVILDVQDDGAGFNPAASPPDSGYGLISLQERAVQLGGNLQVESAPGEGTTVVLCLPIAGQTQ